MHLNVKLEQPAELKHINKRRKRNQQRLPSVVANEQAKAPSCRISCSTHGWRVVSSRLQFRKVT